MGNVALVGTFTDTQLERLARVIPSRWVNRLAAMELERREALERGDVWPAPVLARCAFCERRECFTRIVGPGFDEVACPRHIHLLETWADDVLAAGVKRLHVSSTARQVRGAPV